MTLHFDLDLDPYTRESYKPQMDAEERRFTPHDTLLRNHRSARRIAGMLACIAWAGVVIQFIAFCLYRRVQPHPIFAATVLLFSFFTNLTNMLVAFVFTALAWNRDWKHWPGRRWRERFASGVAAASVVYIIVVGLVYVILLRPSNGPKGLGAIADILMHDVMPVSYPIFWLTQVRPCALKYKQAFFWLAYPLAFVVVTELRGSLTGWYPYPFLNAAQFGNGVIVLNVIALAVLFVLLGWAVVWADRRMKSADERNFP